MYNQENINLTQTVIDEFNHKSVVDFYARSEILKPAEEALCGKYFRRPGRVLVVGCGAGRESIALAKNGFRVVGVDIAKNMLSEAKRKIDRANLSVILLQGDINHVYFKEATFNFITMFNFILQYIPQRKSRIKVLTEMKRILKPDGIIIISFLNFSFFLYLIFYMHLTWKCFLNAFFHNVSRNNLSFYGRIKNFKTKILKQYYNFKFSIRRILPTLLFNSRVAKMEKGDLLWRGDFIPSKSRGKHFFHLYTFKEILKDIDSSGFKLLDIKIPSEFDEEYQAPHFVKKDSLIIYSVLQNK